MDIKFGRETLEISTWTNRFYYNTFSGLLATGMNVHLKENAFIRSIFNLEEPEIEDPQKAKSNRSERVNIQQMRSLFSISHESIFLFLAIGK